MDRQVNLWVPCFDLASLDPRNQIMENNGQKNKFGHTIKGFFIFIFEVYIFCMSEVNDKSTLNLFFFDINI